MGMGMVWDGYGMGMGWVWDADLARDWEWCGIEIGATIRCDEVHGDANSVRGG